MKCQRCQKREATILIKQSMNGQEKEYALCQDCMMELGLVNSFGLDLDNYLGAGFVSPKKFSSYNPSNTANNYNSGVFVPGIKEPQVCRHCNTTLDEIRKKGRLGCNYCYETFEEQLGQVFRRIQSGDKHRGRRIAESKEKSEMNKLHALNEELQMKIKDAVEKEDYESAAKWKTQILKNRETIEDLEKRRRGQVISKTGTAGTRSRASSSASDGSAEKKTVRRPGPPKGGGVSGNQKNDPTPSAGNNPDRKKKSGKGEGEDAK